MDNNEVLYEEMVDCEAQCMMTLRKLRCHGLAQLGIGTGPDNSDRSERVWKHLGGIPVRKFQV
jgi:hypothetical protein